MGEGAGEKAAGSDHAGHQEVGQVGVAADTEHSWLKGAYGYDVNIPSPHCLHRS